MAGNSRNPDSLHGSQLPGARRNRTAGINLVAIFLTAAFNSDSGTDVSFDQIICYQRRVGDTHRNSTRAANHTRE